MKKQFIGLLLIFGGILISIWVIIKNIKTDSSKNFLAGHEASYYETLNGGRVQCQLCPNRCILAKGQRGICGARENQDGKLVSLVYGKVSVTNVDPIEKKPFYHFLPGSKVYSLATVGCNLDCQYCQNWEIAHRQIEDVETKTMTPEEVVEEAIKSGSPTIAFTYNEPTVGFEFIRDTFKIAKQKNLKTAIITNGYINQEPLQELLTYLDAVKIDLKSINEKTYQKLIRGNLQPVLDSIKTVYKSGKWLEIVYLVVPGWTDDLEEIKKTCRWVLENTSSDVPFHLSRFYPNYKLLNLPPTPEETLKAARAFCLQEGLKYVYIGNVENQEGNITYCPDNGEPLIKRKGYFIEENKIDSEGKALECPSKIPGVWK